MSDEIFDKYFVIKKDDVNKYLNNNGKTSFYHCLEVISDGRSIEDKSNNEYLVVNKDEPYATSVESLILNRVSADYIPEKIKEEILKEYAEDLFEEFMQIARFEGSIKLKDVTDVLQIEGEKE